MWVYAIEWSKAAVKSENPFFSQQVTQSKKEFLFSVTEKSSMKEARGLLRYFIHTRTAGTQNDGVRNTQAKAA